MTDDYRIAFLGKTSTSPEENALLRRLGQTLGAAGGELHISNRGGADRAVIDGFRAAGKEPILHSSKLHEAAEWFVIYADEPLIDSILRGWPGVPDTRKWTLITAIEHLKHFVADVERGAAQHN